MYYLKLGVPCTKDGFPICYLDHQECDVEGCRYYFPNEEIGNCVLRTDKNDHCTFDVFSRAWGVSRQRVDQIEKNAIRKLKKWHGRELREILNHYCECAVLHNISPRSKILRKIKNNEWGEGKGAYR